MSNISKRFPPTLIEAMDIVSLVQSTSRTHFTLSESFDEPGKCTDVGIDGPSCSRWKFRRHENGWHLLEASWPPAMLYRISEDEAFLAFTKALDAIASSNSFSGDVIINAVEDAIHLAYCFEWPTTKDEPAIAWVPRDSIARFAEASKRYTGHFEI